MDNSRYLFRGKRLDNVGWVIGYLMDDCYINVPFNDEDVGGRFDDPGEVDPATIGQCTGLKDKNGKLIFEGDIVRHRSLENLDFIAKVEYGSLRSENCRGVWVVDFGFVNEIAMLYVWYKDLEVIGNIHDNLELLESEK